MWIGMDPGIYPPRARTRGRVTPWKLHVSPQISRARFPRILGFAPIIDPAIANMTKRTANIIVLSVVGVIVLGVGVVVGRSAAQQTTGAPTPVSSATSSTTPPAFPEAVVLPDNVFDGTYQIPGTSVSVGYMNAGFWGRGMSVYPQRGDSSPFDPGPMFRISMNNYAPYPPPVDLLVVVDHLKGATNLRDLVATGSGALISNVDSIIHKEFPADPDSALAGLDEDKDGGTYLTVNGHEFFVYKEVSGTARSGWHAISVNKQDALVVYFESNLGTDPFSITAFRDSDQLFFQILSHVTFK
jgi:hypothetical protein